MADNPPVRFPLVEPLETRDATTQYDSKILNGVIEQSTRGTLRVLKRPGTTPKYQGTVGIGQGVDNYLNQLYSISGDFFNSFSGAPILTVSEVTASAGFSQRYGHVAIGFLGSLWVMGGFNSSNAPLNDVWNSTDGGVTWTQITGAAPWSARGMFQGIVFNGVLYIMGGGSSPMVSDKNDVWSTPDGVNWTQQTLHASWPARRNFGLTASNSLMYVAGGAGTIATGALYPDTLYSDVYSSPDGVNWTKLVSNAPWVARANFGFFFLNSALYVIAGQLTDPFVNATSDLWVSNTGTLGTTWTRVSSNPFGMAASGVWPIGAFQSYGMDFTIPSPITVTGGAGGVAAFAFTDFDDDLNEDDFQCGNYAQITFSNVGSGMTAAPTLAFGTNVGFNAQAYAFLDGTANSGAKQVQVAQLNGVTYLFEYFASGSYVSRIWTTTDGVTYTNAGAPGWPPRNGEFFAQGALFMIGGINATTTFNDVWEISISGTTVALNPNVANGFYHFNQTAQYITTPLLVFKSTKDLYDFNATTNTLTKLSNAANYPATTVPGLAYLDGYFFVMDPQGRIWNSAINDPTTWGALAFVTMQNEPAGGVAIAKVLNYVVGLGQWSMEFFQDGGNTLGGISPLVPNISFPVAVGCAAGESVVEMQNSVVWVGQTRREGQSVYMLGPNLVPQRISTPFVDRVIQSDPLTNVSAYTVDTFGHSQYILTLHTSNITLAYSFDSQLWTIWTSMTQNSGIPVTSLSVDPYGTVTAISPSNGYLDGAPILISGAQNTGYNGLFNITVVDQNTFTYQVGSNIGPNSGTAQAANFSENCYRIVASAQVMDVDYVQDPTNGIIYSQDITDVTDNGGPVNLVIITDRFDAGVSTWKTCGRITLLGDLVPTNVVISYTDDDYQSYSSSRYMSTNEGQRATITPAGRFRRRAFKIVHNQPTPFRAESLELELILGSF